MGPRTRSIVSQGRFSIQSLPYRIPCAVSGIAARSARRKLSPQIPARPKLWRCDHSGDLRHQMSDPDHISNLPSISVFTSPRNWYIIRNAAPLCAAGQHIDAARDPPAPLVTGPLRGVHSSAVFRISRPANKISRNPRQIALQTAPRAGPRSTKVLEIRRVEPAHHAGIVAPDVTLASQRVNETRIKAESGRRHETVYAPCPHPTPCICSACYRLCLQNPARPAAPPSKNGPPAAQS